MYLFFILGRSDPGVESDTSDSRDGPNSPFTVLKKADVELLVGGEKSLLNFFLNKLFSSHHLITPHLLISTL